MDNNNVKFYIQWRDTDVTYMLVHSNRKLSRPSDKNPVFEYDIDFDGERVVLPSLRLQLNFIDTKSCKFRSSELVEEWGWKNSWKHCGLCCVCKPHAATGGGMLGGGVHPSLRLQQ